MPQNYRPGLDVVRLAALLPVLCYHYCSEAARLGFKRIVVSGYLGKGAKRPKGIEVVTINSVDQLPRALFVE